ncbi:hypothetical protein VD0004_g343 [Verticillium dahliae]|nr:hypothetical protein VD0004_g343 [Verticillium dahliae]PNH77245.1 hypothetical protein VD0001_g321 [Verticillium dahliae]
MGDTDSFKGFESNATFLTTIGQPQAPLLPRVQAEGPTFVDTQACICSLRTTPGQDGAAGWRCLGNRTEEMYLTNDGKWFNAQNDAATLDGPIHDATNPPDTTKALMWADDKSELVPITGNNDLPVYDQTCSGTNHTTFSTSYYRAAAQLERDEAPVDGAPCFRPGAVSVQIQTIDEWQEHGCAEGFLCQNNTVNSLPQYCTPLTICQQARLAGKACEFEGRNIGMGVFEPIICQGGYYCPPAQRTTIKCPSGSYCQPGAPSPTPCSTGSYCPKGATSEAVVIPVGIVVIVDLFIGAMLLWVVLRQRRKNGKRMNFPGIPFIAKSASRKGIQATVTGYKQLDDETDQEMQPMQPTYLPYRPGTGFQAVLDVPVARAPTVKLRRANTLAALNPQLKAFVDSMSRATDVQADNLGLSFAYNGLTFQPKGRPTPILQNVTGRIDKGSLVAVMGGSGAGKSTFVNVLMGKTKNTGGTVTVNNIPGKIEQYKKIIGYVPQDDVVLPELTVRENILHSARIRLPRSWSDKDVSAHVDSVVDCLELSHVRDSLVGSVGKPVISGGQRKRVSIGMELAAAPMAIFLDEPTSGLDATAASSIMLTLKALARLGISVIVIIHQPRMEIFEMLDNLILLGNGQAIYEGPQHEAQAYFEGMGFKFPKHSNTGDVVTDIITGNGRAYKKGGDVSKEALIRHWASHHRQSESDEESGDDSEAKSIRVSMRALLKRRGARRHKQTWLCLRRSMLQQYRLKPALFFEIGLSVLSGFLIGLSQDGKKGVLFRGYYRAPYEDLSLSADFASPAQLALLQAIGIGLICGAPGVKIFSEEVILHRREAEAGHSRLAYFLAKTVSVMPRMILSCLHFTTLVHILSRPIISWTLAYCMNLLYFYCIYGLASVVSMVVRREDAPLISTMVSFIVGLLSGASPALSQVKTWHMEWLWRASPGTWFAEVYFGQLAGPFQYLYDIDMAAKFTGYNLGTLQVGALVLFAIGTIYRILAFGGLLVCGRMRI